MSAPLLPSLLGATCSGKTAVAVRVAALCGMEVLSADSRQVYRRLDAGTAKPTAAERAAVRHHLLDVADPGETYTAARFARDAREAAAAVRTRGRVPFLVGGSGLYLRAAERGLFPGPPADPALRERWNGEAEALGNEELHRRLSRVDPEAAERLPAADRVRVIRALEVFERTGTPLSEHHRAHREEPSRERCVRFGIEWEREALARRIARRVEAMLEGGWAEEVQSLLAGGLPEEAPAWKALGYAEVRDLVEGRVDLGEARDRIEARTRRFAKRQRTWFRAVEGVTWFPVTKEADLEAISESVAGALRAEAGMPRRG